MPKALVESESNLSEYQKAVDLAWRAENLDVELRKQGNDQLADTVMNAIMDAFMLDPNDNDSAVTIQDILKDAITKCSDYDSGERKFEQLPEVE